MFSGCPSVLASFLPCVHPCVRPVSIVSIKPLDGISRNVTDDVVQGTDEIIRF